MEIPPLVDISEEEEEGEKEGTVEGTEGVGEKQSGGASHVALPKLKWLQM